MTPSAEGEVSKVYCFDTSAFVMLSRTGETIIKLPTTLWEKIDKMMKSGQIISHKTVFSEIDSGTKDPDFITKWIRDKEDYFLKKTDAQIVEFTKIVKKVPGLIDPNQEHEQADPWVIALAIEKSKDCTLFKKYDCAVVSHENPVSSVKIPAACRAFGIRHLSLREFFDEIGLSTDLAGNL